LLAALREELRQRSLSLESVELPWVIERCTQLLRAKNVSQKLKDGIGKGAREIWLKLRGSGT
jgi:hypothetical protein